MNTKFGTIIDRESWEARIVDPFSSMAVRSREGRNLTKQKDNLTGRRFVLWDKIINQSVFLPAVGALEILKDMRDEIVARQQLTDLFKKIAEYGRKKRLGKSE